MDFILNIDNSILQFIQNNIRSDVLDTIMPKVTSLGNAGIIWIIICVIMILKRKYRKYGVMMAIALIYCAIVGNLTLKPIVARIRPFDANPLIDGLLINAPKDFSFPSGHTMVSFSCACILLYMNKKIGIAALILSSAIAFSRLYLYVHYPSDVLMGMIIGILLSYAAIKTYIFLKKHNFFKV
ncbi:MAG TPA: phosphatase PAP2 family protein [Clostridium sp.]|nr:phosphatase PAP2 family protein [Clostridium sp.]